MNKTIDPEEEKFRAMIGSLPFGGFASAEEQEKAKRAKVWDSTGFLESAGKKQQKLLDDKKFKETVAGGLAFLRALTEDDYNKIEQKEHQLFLNLNNEEREASVAKIQYIEALVKEAKDYVATLRKEFYETSAINPKEEGVEKLVQRIAEDYEFVEIGKATKASNMINDGEDLASETATKCLGAFDRKLQIYGRLLRALKEKFGSVVSS